LVVPTDRAVSIARASAVGRQSDRIRSRSRLDRVPTPSRPERHLSV